MTLREKRMAFSLAISQLVVWANEQGMEVCYDREGLKHMDGSLHYKGLAKDLILYRNGGYLTHSDEYRKLGEKWKEMNPSLARWGGDFRGKSAGDGNHFSFEHEGVK